MFQYLSTEDNVNLAKQLSDGFKRSVYWNSYQTFPAKVINNEDELYIITYMSYLVHHFKASKDYLLLLKMVQTIMKQVQKTIKSIFFQEERLKTVTY